MIGKTMVRDNEVMDRMTNRLQAMNTDRGKQAG